MGADGVYSSGTCIRPEFPCCRDKRLTVTDDWKIFYGDRKPHDGLDRLPKPPPWRKEEPRRIRQASNVANLDLEAEKKKAEAFVKSDEMVLAVNAALYLRRPLLLTGKPGTGKSTLISKVAYELKLGRVLRWNVSSRSTVRAGIYDYDAVGRLQASTHTGPAPVHEYLTLGPLGTALVAEDRPRALLIDELDKSDLDFANDLLNIIEDGEYVIRELQRLGGGQRTVKDFEGNDASIDNGRIDAQFFPFVIMTSNDEREFPAAFQRRCVRLTIGEPDETRLAEIVESHLSASLHDADKERVTKLIAEFCMGRAGKEMSTDQLLNAVFLAVSRGDGREPLWSETELETMKRILYQSIVGGAS